LAHIAARAPLVAGQVPITPVQGEAVAAAQGALAVVLLGACVEHSWCGCSEAMLLTVKSAVLRI